MLLGVAWAGLNEGPFVLLSAVSFNLLLLGAFLFAGKLIAAAKLGNWLAF
jgi:hypothetical protein